MSRSPLGGCISTGKKLLFGEARYQAHFALRFQASQEQISDRVSVMFVCGFRDQESKQAKKFVLSRLIPLGRFQMELVLRYK